jgi:hypothetical protein
MSIPDILLAEDEIAAITGYQNPALQVRELRKQGFGRARVNALNRVVLERDHYRAVCAGQQAAVAEAAARPRVLPPPASLRLRSRA